MKEFIYHEPTTLKEATLLITQLKGDARIKAGGTDLLIAMKREMIGPKHVINVKNIAELAYIRYDPKGTLRIGALTSLAEIETSSIATEKFAILSQAARSVASPLIRNRATLGGNICLDSRCHYYNQTRQWLSALDPCYKRKGNRCYIVENGSACHAIFSADTVPALLVLGANVTLVNSEQERVVPLEDFYTGVGTKVNRIHPDELLTEIEIPEKEERVFTHYSKVSERGEVDFAILGVAVRIVPGENQTFDKVDVVVIGTGPRPVRLSGFGTMLKGQKIELTIVQAACEEARGLAGPISNALGLLEYKTKLLPTLVARTIMEAVQNRG